MLLSKMTRSLVACNVYVSAGGHPNHRELLVGLLGETQELCRRANRNKTKTVTPQPTQHEHERVVVVHAFRDGPYDRTSFHLAGAPDLVADVGSSLAARAVQALMQFETETANAVNTDAASNANVAEERIDDMEDNSHPIERGERGSIGRRHPTVGLVDHVSVLPLDENKNHRNNKEPNEIEIETNTARIAGSVARKIGKTLTLLGADVHYYGHAHPSGKELATVRRDSTRFFQDNNNNDNNNNRMPTEPAPAAGQATVGAPHRFVENYNIRLRPGVSRKVARTLTQVVRERSGRGLPFVEALTLEYGREQYEVACNLLDTSATSAGDVEERMREWEQQQQRKQNEDTSGLVETAYRVGTTTNMCLKALREAFTEQGEMAHNKQVFEQLEDYFLVR